MNAKKITILSAAIILTVGITSFSLVKKEKDKIAFVELNRVYLDFTMKKEMEAKLQLIQEKRKVIVDSLELELRMLAGKIESKNVQSESELNLFSHKKQEFLEMRNRFDEDNLETAKRFDEQVFAQINQYVKDYGEKNDYLMILGAEGSGSLMYAKEAINITDDVVKNINQRYKGKLN
jgi:outer membrane protein